MSTVLYAYRVPKDRWWTIARQIRTLYYSETIFPKAIRRLHNLSLDKNKAREFLSVQNDLLASIDKYGDEQAVSVQLFDEGETYLFRVLERGYFFENHCRLFDVKRIFYDDRTDIPEVYKDNIHVADWVDERIRMRQYFIYPILDLEDMHRAAFSLEMPEIK